MVSMARATDWIEGARLRTLPEAASPVIVGAAAAYRLGSWSLTRTLLALLVALLLQIGVNYANDYSDGIRGADDNRQGPPRLTGGGLATPKSVLAAALGCFAAAAVMGLWLVALTGQWFFIALGVLAVAAAWFYTGGTHPYGYMGFGLSELMVFVFFGLFATVGTTYTQTARAPWWVWCLASAMGVLSIALLMINNIRDLPTDREAGKRTVAVRLGNVGSRAAYVALVLAGIMVSLIGTAGAGLLEDSTTSDRGWWILIVLAVVLLVGATVPAHRVIRGDTGRSLIPSLRDTGLYTLGWALALALVLVLA